jgi:hypothetical protein
VSAFQNPADDTLRALLTRVRSIAVVGLSPKPDRPSYQVAAQMQRLGYRIIPVRPALRAVLGETAYPDLTSIPGPIDLVDVFRAPAHVEEIVDACIARQLPILWLQEGVVNEAAALRAQAAGMTVVMDRCVWREYQRLIGAAGA